MAQPKFEVGEMVITQYATYFSEFDGSLGVITQPLQRKLCKDLNLMRQVYSHVYQVRLLVKGETHLWLRPWQLRKLGSGEKSKSRKATNIPGQKRKTKQSEMDSA